MHWWTDTYLEGRRINLLKDKELHFVLGHELRNYIENINIHGWEGGGRQRVWKAGYTSETEENSTVDKIKKKILLNKKEKWGGQTLSKQ